MPELITEGDTMREALTNAEDAVSAVLEAFEDLGRPLPSFLQPLALGAPICNPSSSVRFLDSRL
jgi:predicted RNase H-like HicB family nuclease